MLPPTRDGRYANYPPYMPTECLIRQREQMSCCPGRNSYLSVLFLISLVDLVSSIWICFDSVHLVNEIRDTTSGSSLEQLRILSMSTTILAFTCATLFSCSIIYWRCIEKVDESKEVCYYALKLVFLSSSYILTYIILGLSIGMSAMVTMVTTVNNCSAIVLTSSKTSALEELTMRIVALAAVTTILKTTSLVMGHLIPKLYKKTPTYD